MKVTLLHHTPLNIASTAIRTAWQSFDKSDTREEYICLNCGKTDTKFDINDNVYCKQCGSYNIDVINIIGERDRELIDRVGNKFKHSSTLEHLVYNFYIEGISRALLQELARHRMASLTVKSTRYTLKELKNERIEWFDLAGNVTEEAVKLVSKYCVIPPNLSKTAKVVFEVNTASSLGNIAHSNLDNDRAKYYLPESYQTDLMWTINARSLQNFLYLRSDKSALWEIRKLARKIYEALPEDHKYIFKEKMRDDKTISEEDQSLNVDQIIMEINRQMNIIEQGYRKPELVKVKNHIFKALNGYENLNYDISKRQNMIWNIPIKVDDNMINNIEVI